MYIEIYTYNTNHTNNTNNISIINYNIICPPTHLPARSTRASRAELCGRNPTPCTPAAQLHTLALSLSLSLYIYIYTHIFIHP